MDFEKMSNEELVILAQDGVDFAATELFYKNEGIMWKYIKRFKRTIPFATEEELLSVCYEGFTLSIQNFDINKQCKFTTFYSRLIENQLIRLYNHYKTNKIQEDRKTLSLHYPIASRVNISETYSLEDLIPIKDNYNFIDMNDIQEAIEYSLTNIKERYRHHMVDILMKNENLTTVGKKCNVTKEAVRIQFNKFINGIKEYFFYLNEHKKRGVV